MLGQWYCTIKQTGPSNHQKCLGVRITMKTRGRRQTPPSPMERPNPASGGTGSGEASIIDIHLSHTHLMRWSANPGKSPNASTPSMENKVQKATVHVLNPLKKEKAREATDFWLTAPHFGLLLDLPHGLEPAVDPDPSSAFHGF